MTTSNHCKVTNKSLEMELEEEELLSTTFLKEFRFIRNDLGKVGTEKNLLRI